MGKGFFSLFAPTPANEAVFAVAGLQASPLVVTEGEPAVGVEKVAHARYRLDAIKRTIDQQPNLSKEHMAEFKAEVRDHAYTLVKAGVISDDRASELIRDGKGAAL